MRGRVAPLGISAVLFLAPGGVATASDWGRIGPYPTYEACEVSQLAFEATGHVTTGCFFWSTAWYFDAQRVD